MIILDVGNTSISAARWTASAEVLLRRPDQMILEPLDSYPTPTDNAGCVECLAAVRSMLHAGEELRLVSVVPLVEIVFRREFSGLVVLDHRSDWPFAIDVVEPAAVGADRYANVNAAVAMGWSSALVVDVGTATTFDLLDEGLFRGGLIAPGPAFAARCLGERAARLAPVCFEPVPLAAGRDTSSAMAAGSFHVGVRGILSTIRALRRDLGDTPVVLTGGLAEAVRSHVVNDEDPGLLHVDRHWTLKGAALAPIP